MSPEQARGQAVDRRADIWAFGVVLFESLTGSDPFEGPTVSDSLARVLEREADLGLIPATTPRSLRRLLHRCLVKERQERLQHIGDARVEIQEALESPASMEEETTAIGQPERGRFVVALAGAFVAGAVLVGAAWLLSKEAAPPALPIVRSTLPMPTIWQQNDFDVGVLAMSPDGARLAHVMGNGLALRALDRADSTPIANTEGALSPFFSPDGDWLGFWSEGELKKVSLVSGAIVALCSVDEVMGATWTSDGRVLFGRGQEGVWQVSAAGGDAEVVVEVSPGEVAHGPQLLPAGETIIYSIGVGSNWNDAARIVAYQPATGEQHVLVQGASDGRYVPTGHLIYARFAYAHGWRLRCGGAADRG